MTDSEKRSLRNALGQFATGITVVTTCVDDVPYGMTVNSFSSVSLEPPLVLWSVGKQSNLYSIFAKTSHYAINILSAQQQSVSDLFASPVLDRFSQIDWEEGLEGLPLISGCKTQFQCKVVDRIDAGDHTILLAQVEAFTSENQAPLLFFAGGYHNL